MSTCSRCGAEARPGQRYCAYHHADYMKEWRKTHPLTGEARRKANARSYAHTYRNRGVITKLPCSKCGSDKSEMHHEDYSKPLEVIWLCRKCHLEHHREKTDG